MGHAPPPKKKSGNTCLIVFLVTLGIGLLGAGIAAYMLYSKFGGVIGATGELASAMTEAQSAPGTDEMRDLGCEPAMAIDVQKVAEAIQRLDEEVAKHDGHKTDEVDLGDVSAMLMCQTKKDVTCKEVVKAYLDAVEPDGEIIVTVQKGQNKVECTERYDADGEFMGAEKEVKGLVPPQP